MEYLLIALAALVFFAFPSLRSRRKGQPGMSDGSSYSATDASNSWLPSDAASSSDGCSGESSGGDTSSCGDSGGGGSD